MADSRSSRKSPTQFLKEIRGGKSYDVVLLTGEEEYLLKQTQREYVARVVPQFAREFDFSDLRLSETDGRSLWNALTTMPFVAPRRCVVVEASSEPRGDTAAALATYLKNPSATTSLVLVVSGEASGAIRSADLPDHVVVVEFALLRREEDRRRWAAEYVKERLKRIEDDALTYLMATSSPALSDLAAKLDQACLYIGEDEEVSAQTLMKVSGVTSEFTVFNLEDAILATQPVQAHRVARSLLEGGEELLRLLAFHRSSVLKLWQANALLRRFGGRGVGEESDQAWKSVLKGQHFKRDQFASAARRIGEARLRQAVVNLIELEVRAKSGSQSLAGYYEWLWRLTSVSVPLSEPNLIPVS